MVHVTGTLINAGTVLAGTTAGTVLGDRLPERVREVVMDGLGLVVLLVGIDQGLAAFRPPFSTLVTGAAAGGVPVLIVLGSILLGGIAGEIIGIERGLVAAGDALKRRFGSGQARFTEGFVVASLVFCVGPLTILGAISEGLSGDYSLLAGTVAGAVGDPSRSPAIAAVTATGGVMILAIGLRLLRVKEIRVVNLLPALLLAPMAVLIVELFR